MTQNGMTQSVVSALHMSGARIRRWYGITPHHRSYCATHGRRPYLPCKGLLIGCAHAKASHSPSANTRIDSPSSLSVRNSVSELDVVTS